MRHRFACYAIAAAIGLVPGRGAAQVKAADSTAGVDSAKVHAAAPEVKVSPAPAAKEEAGKKGDKVVGRDEKGRTIYEGPRGGRYYISKTGGKVYVRKKKE